MAADQIEVVPAGDGTWGWRKRVDDQVVDGASCETRREAIDAARAARGDELVTLTRADGSEAGTARLGGGMRIVLLRGDGSEYGELDPAETSGTAVRVSALVPRHEGADGNG